MVISWVIWSHVTWSFCLRSYGHTVILSSPPIQPSPPGPWLVMTPRTVWRLINNMKGAGILTLTPVTHQLRSNGGVDTKTEKQLNSWWCVHPKHPQQCHYWRISRSSRRHQCHKDQRLADFINRATGKVQIHDQVFMKQKRQVIWYEQHQIQSLDKGCCLYCCWSIVVGCCWVLHHDNQHKTGSQ